MIVYTTASSREDLSGILNLQKANLPETLSRDQLESQGFVTVTHSYEQLKRLNDIEKHTIVKDEQKVVAYILAMTELSKHDIPILIPMFVMFNSISYKNKLISAYQYMVVGQVCMDKDYRGHGILENCYASYRNQFMNRYDFAITEIASTNLRSLRAHSKIGFEEISRYTADNIEWHIVLWDWKRSS